MIRYPSIKIILTIYYVSFTAKQENNIKSITTGIQQHHTAYQSKN